MLPSSVCCWWNWREERGDPYALFYGNYEVGSERQRSGLLWLTCSSVDRPSFGGVQSGFIKAQSYCTGLCHCWERRLLSLLFLKPLLITEGVSPQLLSKICLLGLFRAVSFVAYVRIGVRGVPWGVRDKKPHLGFWPRCHFWGLTSQGLSLLSAAWWRWGKNKGKATPRRHQGEVSRSPSPPPYSPAATLSLLSPRNHRRGRREGRGTPPFPPVPATGWHPGDLGCIILKVFSQPFPRPPVQDFLGRKIQG